MIMKSKKIVKEYVEKQYGYENVEVIKSQRKCPICGRTMYYPKLEHNKDLDEATDMCPIHGAFCIKHM